MEIVVKMEDGDRKVHAHAVPGLPGLAVHWPQRKEGERKGDFSITHIGTGLALPLNLGDVSYGYNSVFPLKFLAAVLRVLRESSEKVGVDWTQNPQSKGANKKMKEAADLTGENWRSGIVHTRIEVYDLRRGNHPFFGDYRAAEIALYKKGAKVELGVSRYPNEEGWCVDSMMVNGVPDFMHGEGDRTVAKQRLVGRLAAAVEKAEREFPQESEARDD